MTNSTTAASKPIATRGLTRSGVYVGEGSPDRADAMVWAFHELFLAEQEVVYEEQLVEPSQISPI